MDGVETEQKTENVYTVENLEEDSVHTVKTIAIDEKGNRKETRTITVKVEPRMYLYNAGNEYTELTKGWINDISISQYNKTKLNRRVEPNKNSASISLNLRNTGPFEYSTIRTVNPIDLSPYKTMKVEYEILQENYFWEVGLGDTTIFQDVIQKYDTKARRKGTSETRLPIGKHVMEVDLTNISTNINYLYCIAAVGVQSDPRGEIQVYSIWLEK